VVRIECAAMSADYPMMWGWSSDRVAGIEWQVVAAALVLDIGTYAGLRMLRR
jgi:hypothetical protein